MLLGAFKRYHNYYIYAFKLHAFKHHCRYYYYHHCRNVSIATYIHFINHYYQALIF